MKVMKQQMGSTRWKKKELNVMGIYGKLFNEADCICHILLHCLNLSWIIVKTNKPNTYPPVHSDMGNR